MRKIILLVAVLWAVCIPFISCVSAGEQQIDVAICTHKLSVQISGQDNFVISDKLGRELFKSSAKQKGFLNVKNGNLYFNNIALPDDVIISPQTGEFLEVNRRVYRGVMRVYLDNENLIFVVNELPLEKYLESVLPTALATEYPDAVAKAQAVTMRSWAYAKAGKNIYGNYDVQANDYRGHEPLYLGKSSESEKYSKVLKDTYGEVAIYNGNVAELLWHIDSGGYTESGKNYLGREVPYLLVVKDWHKDNKEQNVYRWQKEFTATELDVVFEREKYKLGNILSIKMSKLPKIGQSIMSKEDRTSTGRLKYLEIVGANDKITMDAEHFVRIAGLESTLLGMSVGMPVPSIIDTKVEDAMGNEVELVKIAVNLDQPDGYQLPGTPENVKRIPRTGSEKIVFYGIGKGHGVGLSLQGAKIMAEQALEKKKELSKKAIKVVSKVAEDKKDSASKNLKLDKKTEIVLDDSYYKDILAYYFPRTTIIKKY